MRITKRAITALFTALTVAAISGCGGGGSGSSPAPGSTASSSVSGIVTDPPISGSMVRLVDDSGAALSQVVVTDDNGRFMLSHNAADLSEARIVATGGHDAQSGYSFQGLTLKAPVTGGEVAVTPLSTLVTQEMADEFLSLEQAQEAVAKRFGLKAEEVLNDPAQSAPVQRAAMQITRLAAALRNEGNGFTRAGGELRSQGGDFDKAATSLSMDSGLSEATRDQLARLAVEQAELAAIDTGGSAQRVIEAANRIAFRHALARYLSNEHYFTPADDVAWANVEGLADVLWKANGRRGIPSSGPQIANVIRYAVQFYQVDLSTLGQTEFQVPQALANDSRIPTLAGMQVIDHSIPLAPGEELGDDNRRRLDYFYGSDLSPRYRAEQVMAGVYDDATLDPVYTAIAEDLASVGRLEAAEGVLRAQIFQPQQRARAYREAGFALLEAGYKEQALGFLDSAQNLYDDDLEARGGAAVMTADDTSFYYTLSRNYLQAEETDKAASAMTYFDRYVELTRGQPYTTAHGKVLTAWWIISEAAVEEAVAGEITSAKAAESVDMLAKLTRATGIFESTKSCGDNYLLKALYTARYAEFYAALGMLDEVERAIGEFEQIRQHECTRERTESYPTFIVAAYGALGRIDDFKQMVTETVTNTRLRDKSYAAAVLYEALEDARSGNVDAAITRIEAEHAAADDRLEQFTYERTSRSTPYLALNLFQEGNVSAGDTVLDRAWVIALSDDFWNSASASRRIAYGCQKVAQLRHDFVDAEAGRAEMRQCRDTAIPRFANETTSNRLLAFRQLAEGLNGVGLANEALAMIDQAKPLADAIADAEDRGSQRRMLGALAIELGGIDRGMALLAASVEDLNAQMAQRSDESDARSAISDAFDLADKYLLAADAVRANAGAFGKLDSAEQSTVQQARAQARGLLDGSSAEVTVGALALNQSLSSPSHRASRYRDLVSRLARARAFDAAVAVVEDEDAGHSEPDRYRMLQSIAESMIEANDFPGSGVASQDLDGDGRPDFFHPLSTEAERTASGLYLDDDMDGDGTPDAVDLTPMCANCETL